MNNDSVERLNDVEETLEQLAAAAAAATMTPFSRRDFQQLQCFLAIQLEQARALNRIASVLEHMNLES